MADELRAAAERSLQRRERNLNHNPGTIQIVEDAAMLANAVLDTPDWHERPPVSGLYAWRYRSAGPDVTGMGYYVTTGPLANLAPDCLRYFGPIPPDPQKGGYRP